MKYIRTKDGIFEIKATPQSNAMYSGSQAYRIYDHIQMVDRDVFEKDIIKQADTIEELCDEFIAKTDNGKPFVIKRYEIYSNLQFGFTIYGAIWVVGENDEPILKSVAKINNKLELL